MKKTIVFIVICVFGFAFSTILRTTATDPVYIPASPQRSGDSVTGYQYLITGDYLKSGIPYSYFKLAFGNTSTNYLQRTGLNQTINYDYTAVKAPNGEIVVAPNCLQCHAQVFDNKLIIGLGNTTIDFTS